MFNTTEPILMLVALGRLDVVVILYFWRVLRSMAKALVHPSLLRALEQICTKRADNPVTNARSVVQNPDTAVKVI